MTIFLDFHHILRYLSIVWLAEVCLELHRWQAQGGVKRALRMVFMCDQRAEQRKNAIPVDCTI